MDELIYLRRQLHQHPEIGWTEFQTSDFVATYLKQLGFNVKIGREVLSIDHRLGLPSTEVIEAAFQRARDNGADETHLELMKGGMTGVVATIGEGKPITAFRFDLDALPIQEATDNEHRPYRDGFSSSHDGVNHACGHDGHTAIGLMLGKYLAANSDNWSGTIKLIFQPAEEGCRGALSMQKAGVADDVEQLICFHLGLLAPSGTVIAGARNFLASSKHEVIFTGKSAHAGLSPESGRNALLAAASAALQIHSIERHSHAQTRVNVGVLQAGTGLNLVPSTARLQFELRASSMDALNFLKHRSNQVIGGSAMSFGVDYEVQFLGHASTADSDYQLIEHILACAQDIPQIQQVTAQGDFGASEDATIFMETVQKRGGHCCYVILGSDISEGHHTPGFDFDESSLSVGLVLLQKLVSRIAR